MARECLTTLPLTFAPSADIINAVAFSTVIAYGIGMFFYNRRMQKTLGDAAVFNTATLPATEAFDEKDSASIEKVDIVDAQNENAIRV